MVKHTSELEQVHARLKKEIAKRKRAEKALRESERHIRRKLDTILSPETDINMLELSDIIDSAKIQKLMDKFYQLTHVGIGIIDLHGKVLVGTGWQDICTKFHRVNPESCQLCIESDLELSRDVPAGTFKQYRCKNNMWDIATPIMLGNKHMGNIFLGQFLFDDEAPDYETFRQQAHRYGFNEQEYIAALDRVPRWSQEKVNTAMSFYTTFAEMIGNLSYSNVKLANALEERKHAEEKLRQSEHDKTIQNQIANIFLTIPDEEMYGEVLAIVLQVMKSKFGIFGYIAASGDLVIPSMTREIWGECQVPDKSIIFPQDTWGKSLWGRAIREKIALYSDGPFHTPEGHVHIDHFLTTPIVFGNETIGLISVANNERGYTERDKELLEAITGYISPILNARLQRDRQEQERKQAERELQHSNDLLRAIIEAAPTAIIGLDLDGNVQMMWNPAAEKMLGWSAQEAMGHLLPSVPVESREEFSRFREWIRSGKTLDGVEVRRQRRDGTPIDYSIYASPLHDAEGQINGNVAVLVDITERRHAEEEREYLAAQIREQAQELQQILATVPEGVLLLDAKGRVVQANPIAEKLLVTLAGAKVGDTLTHLGNRSLTELLTSPATKGLWHEVKFDQCIFEVIARPMNNDRGREQWVLVINDVTQAREIQEQLQRQERMAAVGQLAAGIAHDFNNIMAIIVLYAQMIARVEGLPEHVQERITVIDQQAWHATRLIQQILDFSRKSVLERQPLDLLPLLKEQCKLLERTLPEDIELRLDYEPDEYIVNADLVRIQQVIMNLAVNARDAMPKGGKLRIVLSNTTETDKVRCVTCGEVSDGEWVRITVTDTGSGISPDVLPYIFEPFFTTKAPGQGTGLGLSQVYGIVKQHEGHIDVMTRVEKGTTFSVYLPVLLTPPPKARIGDIQALVQGQGETILVVEDNATLRQALMDNLSLLNYRVREAANGREALKILQQSAGEIALVVSDLVMPEMGGQALFYTMRQLGLTSPLVLLSGHPMENELRSLQAQGLAGWMFKPLDMEQLSHLLAQLLSDEDAGPKPSR
ncbi:MAG: PocR ligand-binding domain-containing protein [Anaerolineae bacterium]|nr:PocR ligand-binding domain-containing protein [Anaerolineae bacterium]